MLRLMRDYATSWMIKLILGAIVVVFVFWGVGSFRNRKANMIAQVNGEVITLDEYRSTYNRLLEQTRQRFGGSLNEEMLNILQLDRQALDQLIDQRLMLQKAAELKFRVTDEEIIDSIKRIQAFQANGLFDNTTYTRVLSLNRLTPEEFEALQRNSLLVEKVQSFLLSQVLVSENEIEEFYKWQNASVAIDHILFNPESYKDIEPTDEELKAYFDSNQETYKTPPKVKASYIHFNPDSYRSDVAVSDEEVATYYENRKATFESPKTVEARHILFRVEADAAEEAVEAKRAEAEEILKKIKGGEDFAALAKEYSEGPTKDNGGYLGEFKKEDMVAPFAEKAFSMNAGEVSEPVRTQFGWHLIKVEKVNPASVRSLDEAKDEIRDKLTADAARNIAYDKAEAFFDMTMEGDDLSVIGKEAGYEVAFSPFFSATGAEAGVAERKKFADAAFSLALNQMSEIQDMSDGYYILQPVEKEAGKIPELSAVKETVKLDLIKEKQVQSAENDAKALLKTLQEKGPEGLTQGQSAKAFQTTEFFKRSEAVPDIGWEGEISKAAFALSKEKPLWDGVIKGRKGYYIIRLSDRRLPDMAEYDKEKDTIKNSLLSQKQFQALDAWLNQIKSQSEITIQSGFFE